MERINILKEEKIQENWKFTVEIGSGADTTKHIVTVNESVNAKELVLKSFRFLLEREPKESILKKFNLEVISDYFPEYEEYIKDGK